MQAQENAMSKQVRKTEKSETVKAVSVGSTSSPCRAPERSPFGAVGDYVFPIRDAVDNSAKMRTGRAND